MIDLGASERSDLDQCARFSEAVTVKGFGTGKLIFLAGVGSEDENGPRGNIRHHNDLVAQCEYALASTFRLPCSLRC